MENGAEAEMVAKYNRTEGCISASGPGGSNEIEVAHRLREEMDRIRPLPKRYRYAVGGRHHVQSESALEEITKTLGETVLIVATVVFLFMGSVRTALVPLVAMPVSLVGAAIFIAFGFSLNLLTILAIVLSVGLVVDDAIVVVANARGITNAALLGSRELVGPIIAMTITLAAVYARSGFRWFDRVAVLEFAMTLAAAVWWCCPAWWRSHLAGDELVFCPS